MAKYKIEGPPVYNGDISDSTVLDQDWKCVSLGNRCEIAFQLFLHTTKSDTDYFDWLISPGRALKIALSNNLEDIIEKDSLLLSQDKTFVHNEKNGILYFHSFPKDEKGIIKNGFLDFYEDFASKERYLREKFLRMLQSDRNILFFRRGDRFEEIDELCEMIAAMAPGLNFRMISIQSQNVQPKLALDKRVIIRQLPDGPSDTFGDREAWGAMLLALGVTNATRQKTYDQIIRRDRPGVFSAN